MKKSLIQFAFLCFILIVGCQNKNKISGTTPLKTAQEQVSDGTISIDLVALTPLQLGKAQAIEVNDQVFKTPKKYMVYDFKKLLLPYLKMGAEEVNNYEITFVCNDSYRPVMPLEQLLRGMPYLAFHDVDAQQGDWMAINKIKFAPFYLVWKDVSFTDHSWAMPYGLVQIEIKKNDYKLIPKDTTFMAGFVLFKDKCNRCHQINAIGGDMGPELNYPKNVTEYWKEADLKAFIKQPKNYRQNAKMPEINVSELEINQIVGYLKYMAGHKTL